eukprot:TRINITY_DN3451_c0_g3_i3.p1 TRINITY_DN3451_c0_g3~~TRINITY_DN3451_c0_g3_i3.p1  ORF type:complete len:263 (+),score=55.76 TRINITY_DN3451_c0_g3_i3:44-790(+)
MSTIPRACVGVLTVRSRVLKPPSAPMQLPSTREDFVRATLADLDVLLIKRGTSPHKGWWSVPGGRIELGETVSYAAAREVREETDLHCAIVMPTSAAEHVHHSAGELVQSMAPVVATVDVIQPAEDDDAADTQQRYHYVLHECLAVPIGYIDRVALISQQQRQSDPWALPRLYSTLEDADWDKQSVVPKASDDAMDVKWHSALDVLERRVDHVTPLVADVLMQTAWMLHTRVFVLPPMRATCTTANPN